MFVVVVVFAIADVLAISLALMVSHHPQYNPWSQDRLHLVTGVFLKKKWTYTKYI